MIDFSEQQLKAAYRRGQWSIAWMLVRSVVFCGLVACACALIRGARTADAARLERIHSRIDYLVNQVNELTRKEAGRPHGESRQGAGQ